MNKFCFLGLLMFSLTSNAALIDFEDLGVASGSQLNPANNTVVTSGGFDFINGPTSIIADLHIPNNSGNSVGTTTEMVSHGDLIMTKNGGGTFTLNSFDLGSSFLEVASFSVTGTFFGGGSIAQVIGLDGDETTLQTFSPNAGFTNLVQVNWLFQGGSQGLFNIDNIVVDADGGTVPLPSTLLLLVLGILGVGANRKKR